MTFDLTLRRTVSLFNAGAAKFGSAGLATGVYGSVSADGFLSATGIDGGALTTGTIEAWVKTTAGAVTKVAVGRDNWYWIGHVNGQAQAKYGNGAGEVSLASATAINDGLWHHMALVISAGAGSLYVDGTRVATSASTGTTGTSTAGFTVGGFGDNTLNGFDWASVGAGVIDEVRLSNVTRYTGATYTVPTTAFVDDGTTVALYHLDGAATDSHNSSIAANDANIIYSPYNWNVTAGGAKTINAGAYFRVLIGGTVTAITLNFDVSNMAAPASQIAYRVDQGGWQTATVAATVALTMPSGNAWTTHSVEVVVKSTTETANRWNAPQNTAVVLTSVSCVGAPATVAAQSRPRTGLVYGDSITEGVRTLNSASANDTDRNDATVGWAWRLGENLGAEIGAVGFGGTGISVAGSGNVPILPTSYSLLWSGQARSFTTSPDFVVINIGANDSTTNTVAAMTTLLNNLLTATSSQCQIFVMRPFNGTQAANLQSAVAACSTPARVTYVDTTGWWSTADSSDSLHPFGYTNVMNLSPRLASAVKGVIGTTKRWVNVGGTAKAVSAVIKA